jgi:hypothetical protein
VSTTVDGKQTERGKNMLQAKRGPKPKDTALLRHKRSVYLTDREWDSYLSWIAQVRGEVDTQERIIHRDRNSNNNRASSSAVSVATVQRSAVQQTVSTIQREPTIQQAALSQPQPTRTYEPILKDKERKALQKNGKQIVQRNLLDDPFPEDF